MDNDISLAKDGNLQASLFNYIYTNAENKTFIEYINKNQ